MAYWLIKSEPFKYSWDQFVADGTTIWDGVRSYPARLNLRAMKKGDLAFFYHSNEGLEIVGIAKIIREAYPDPTQGEGETWSAVDVEAAEPLENPVSLKQIKEDPLLAGMELIRLGRLSVSSVSKEEWKKILKISENQ